MTVGAGRSEIAVGVIGSGWIVRTHVHALHSLNHLAPLPARVRMKWICGRRAEKMAALAAEVGITSVSSGMVGGRHILAWQSRFVHEWRAFLMSVLAVGPVDPLQGDVS